MNIVMILDSLCVDAFYDGLLALIGVTLLLLYRLRWRHEGLAQKYSNWQKEAQSIEVVTHVALYNQQHQDSPTYPRISIVVPAYNQKSKLEYLLPQLLKQEYSGSFEVIVVDQLSEDDSKDVITRLESEYPNLRYTSLSPSLRYIAPRKLAITLGVKASRGEWVIVVNPETVPSSKQWLQYFAENLATNLDLVQGYYNYEDDGSSCARRAILERVRKFNDRLHAFEKGFVLSSETANFAVRKKWFLQERGFADNLSLPFGEETIFAYNHGNAERTALLSSPDTKLVEEVPASSSLQDRRIQNAEVLRHLHGISTNYCLRNNMISVLVYVLLIANLTYVVLRVWQDLTLMHYTVSCLYGDMVYLLFILASFFFPVFFIRKSLKALDERNYGAYVYIFDLLEPWRNLKTDFVRRLKRKSFVRKFI